MITSETDLGFGRVETRREKGDLWSRLATALRVKLDSCTGVEVPVEDRVRTELLWGNQPVECLAETGMKKRMVLTAEGRRVASDNLDRWKQELVAEGKECNSRNLMKKYEEAASGDMYNDSISGLVKSSIRMRIGNLKRKESQAGNTGNSGGSNRTPENNERNSLERFRTEQIADEIPTLKQKTLAAWQYLQGMTIACDDLRWRTKGWLYDHQREVNNGSIILAVCAVSIVLGVEVAKVSRMELLRELTAHK